MNPKAMCNILSDLINRQGWCVADGATETNLFGRGLETGYPPELWLAERLDDILWLHGSFLTTDVNINNTGGDDRRGRRGTRCSS